MTALSHPSTVDTVRHAWTLVTIPLWIDPSLGICFLFLYLFIYFCPFFIYVSFFLGKCFLTLLATSTSGSLTALWQPGPGHHLILRLVSTKELMSNFRYLNTVCQKSNNLGSTCLRNITQNWIKKFCGGKAKFRFRK